MILAAVLHVERRQEPADKRCKRADKHLLPSFATLKLPAPGVL